MDTNNSEAQELKQNRFKSSWQYLSSLNKSKKISLIIVLFILVVTLISIPFIVNNRQTIEQHAQGTDNIPVSRIDTTGKFVDGEILLRFKAGAPKGLQDSILSNHNAEVVKDIPQIRVKEIKVPAEALDEVVKALSHNPAVEFAEKNWLAGPAVTPNDPYFKYSGTGILLGGQWGDGLTQAEKAWDITTGSTSVILADVDSGIDDAHPDLSGQLVPGTSEVGGNTIDTSGHGEYVAGTMAENANNGIGAAGYCWNCKLMPVKITSTGSAADSAMASGIIWAADHASKVINVSYAGTSSSSSLCSAVSYATQKGSIVVAAAGNSGNSTPNYPANCSGAIAVAASDQLDNLMSYSNYGSWVQVAAPTGDITTWLKDPVTGQPYGYGPVGGTSISAPVVSGIIGLMFSLNPNATVSQIKNALFSSTDPITGKTQSGSSVNIQYGRVNAYKALLAIGGQSPSLTPTLSVTPTPTTTPLPTPTPSPTPTPAPDTQAPVVSVSSPITNSALSGPVTITVSATDNVSVSKVDLYIDGNLYATNTTSPYQYYWDTTKVANGGHTIYAKAYDSAGNVGTSSTVSVSVNNQLDTTAPVVTITSPLNGSVVSKTVTIAASATDDVGVSLIEVYIDNKFKTSANSSSISTTWNTNGKNVTKGTHTITVKAYDAAGHVTPSSISVIK